MVEEDVRLGHSSSEGSIEVIDLAEVVQDEETQQGPTGKTTKHEWTRGSYHQDEHPGMPFMTRIAVFFGFTVLVFFARIADWLRAKGIIKMVKSQERPEQADFVSLENPFETMFINNIYRISTDVVNRPITGVPGVLMKLKERYTDDYGWTHKFTGNIREVVNFGSYNYLGFSHNDGPCAEEAAKQIDAQGLHAGGTRHEAGNHQLQRDVERCVAEYLGVEDAICFPMGFGTNSMNLSALVNQNSLILSDELNHASLVLGSRLTGAVVKVFKHNNPADCEKKILQALSQPNPKTGGKYDKILIVIEGIYSMEGTIVNLPKFIELKKKVKAYMFLDEAHSVGALGPSGRGVVEYWGCDPHDVDIMMGTLTKSFAAAGGYMGGKKSTIDHMRINSAGACYGPPMSAPVIAQVKTSMKIMCGQDGTDIGHNKAVQLLRNTRYFRQKLKALGFLVYGHDDSPVVPLMTFFIPKVVYFGRETLKHQIGAVSVGYPATPLDQARIRFCISADHTKDQLDYVLRVCDKIGDDCATKYGTARRHLLTTIEY